MKKIISKISIATAIIFLMMGILAPFSQVEAATSDTSTTAKSIYISDAHIKEMIKEIFPDRADKIISRMLYRAADPVAQDISPLVKTPIDQPNSRICGYRTKSTNIKGAAGDFTVPNPVPTYNSGAWVGVGGSTNTSPLLQIGIDLKDKYAWYEEWPSAPYPIFSLGVNPGNHIITAVYLEQGYSQLWFIFIQDSETGGYYATDISFATDRSAAIWGYELGALYHGTMGTIQYSSCNWNDSNNSYQLINSDSATEVDRLYCNGASDGVWYPSGLSTGSPGSWSNFTLPYTHP